MLAVVKLEPFWVQEKEKLRASPSASVDAEFTEQTISSIVSTGLDNGQTWSSRFAQNKFAWTVRTRSYL